MSSPKRRNVFRKASDKVAWRQVVADDENLSAPAVSNSHSKLSAVTPNHLTEVA
jgi:hypothetical protein